MSRKRSPRPIGEPGAEPEQDGEEAKRDDPCADEGEALVREDAGGDMPARLEAELAAAFDAWQEREDILLRQLAEAENQRRRLARDLEIQVEQARGRLLEPMITILDDLERALAHLPADDESPFSQGIRQIADRLRESLLGMGLRPIDAMGQKFDPALHEAMLQVETADVAKGHVVQEIQKGYLLGKRVLRPSKVAVSA